MSSTQSSSHFYESNSQDSDSNRGGRQLTPKYLQDLFKKEWKLYYRTPELNEKLYLHYKGFPKIQSLELFPDLKCLYFEGNGIHKIEGLETNTKLRSLYL
jgi:dynein assembly factor 1